MPSVPDCSRSNQADEMGFRRNELLEVADLPGLAEAPPDLRFAVVTVGRAVGTPTIERIMDNWAAGIDGAEWWFGNADQAISSA
ncbi:hypothetical protein ACFC6U_36845 [Kitasatospora purpeofusca]|uniref:hypothetical protein n=1 Tax=Kitasatospora purpeofusca TaxID=67352 RepID=UPI0035E32360